MATYQITIDERTSEGRDVLDFLQKNKNVKFKQKAKDDPTKMTKEEFYAQIDEALEQVDRGEYTELHTKNDIKDYIGSL